MDVALNINKTIEQNAQVYFEKAKKVKKKIPGVKKVIDDQKKRFIQEQAKIQVQQESKIKKVLKKKEWFEKFRWFYSSDDFLVIGGRDATTNEIVIKKHTEHDDIVFHTELPGSSFVIIKNPDHKKIPESTIQEAAECCASFSKSWKSSRGNAEVYHITPGQVSKEAKSGEYIAKGAFMISGKRNFMNVKLNLAICNHDGRIMCGPVNAIKKHAKTYVELIQGAGKLSDTAKKIQKIIGGELDEIVRALPPDCVIKKEKR